MNVLQDTHEHIDKVAVLVYWVSEELQRRADGHDASKLQSPEKEMFEIWRPKLDAMAIDSPEYKNALAQMGEGLKHHYAENRHHPEHFSNGVSDMTLIDILEMICDWKAAASRNDKEVNLEWARERFGIEPQLLKIFANTLLELAA